MCCVPQKNNAFMVIVLWLLSSFVDRCPRIHNGFFSHEEEALTKRSFVGSCVIVYLLYVWWHKSHVRSHIILLYRLGIFFKRFVWWKTWIINIKLVGGFIFCIFFEGKRVWVRQPRAKMVLFIFMHGNIHILKRIRWNYLGFFRKIIWNML